MTGRCLLRDPLVNFSMMTVSTHLMFQGGKAQAAIDLYASVFPRFAVVSMEKYVPSDPTPGLIKIAKSILAGTHGSYRQSGTAQVWISRHRCPCLSISMGLLTWIGRSRDLPTAVT